MCSLRIGDGDNPDKLTRAGLSFYYKVNLSGIVIEVLDINFADVTVSLSRERKESVMGYERSVICTPLARLPSYCFVNCVDDTLTDTGLTSFILNGRVKEKKTF